MMIANSILACLFATATLDPLTTPYLARGLSRRPGTSSFLNSDATIS